MKTPYRIQKQQKERKAGLQAMLSKYPDINSVYNEIDTKIDGATDLSLLKVEVKFFLKDLVTICFSLGKSQV
jgi:hypothetical protein